MMEGGSYTRPIKEREILDPMKEREILDPMKEREMYGIVWYEA